MGYGSYTSADWAKLRKSSKISESSTADQMFQSKKMEDRFNPRLIEVRESRDSEEHPHSTPVVIGLDVTGSMGYLAAEIAKNGLNETMMKIYSTNPIEDPQMMFAAIGDVSDAAPLQVTHFESDIRIAEQLLALWLEYGGGDAPEDYELLWYFAAKHTKIDSFEKRGKKGILFTIGDADCHPEVSGDDLKAIFGDRSKTLTSGDILKMAQEKYEVFHVFIGDEQGMRENTKNFGRILQGRLMRVEKSQVDKLPEILISTLQMVNGAKKEEVLNQWSELARPVVATALENLNFAEGDIIF